MPNHVTNTLSIQLNEGVDAQKFLKKLRGEDSDRDVIDFAVIIPPPDNLFTGNLSTEDRKRCVQEGIPNWYDWQCENWGTKWNAYDQSIEDQGYGSFEIRFDTAWSPPFPIIEALKEWDEIEYLGGSWLEEGHQSAGVF